MKMTPDHTVSEVRFLTIYPLVVLPFLLAKVDQIIVASALPQIAEDYGTGAFDHLVFCGPI